MNSAGAILQKVISETLKADSGVAALVDGRIHDHSPARAKYPHVTFGPSEEYPSDADCLTISEYHWQIDTWSQTSGNRIETRDLTAAIKAALHKAALDISPFALSVLEVRRIRILGDKDPLLTHGVVEIYAEIEE